MVRYIVENDEDTVFESAPGAYLVLLVNGRPSQTFPLRGTVHIGRDKNNSVVVADRKVSRHHATLFPADASSFTLSDQGSVNGTYLNGVLISQPTRLKHHDKVSVGDTHFVFTNNPSDMDAFVDMPAVSPVPSPSIAPQPIPAQNSALVMLGLQDKPIWLLIGCMGLLIVALMLILAALTGLLVGRGFIAGIVVAEILNGLPF